MSRKVERTAFYTKIKQHLKQSEKIRDKPEKQQKAATKTHPVRSEKLNNRENARSTKIEHDERLQVKGRYDWRGWIGLDLERAEL